MYVCVCVWQQTEKNYSTTRKAAVKLKWKNVCEKGKCDAKFDEQRDQSCVGSTSAETEHTATTHWKCRHACVSEALIDVETQLLIFISLGASNSSNKQQQQRQRQIMQSKCRTCMRHLCENEIERVVTAKNQIASDIFKTLNRF